MSTWVVPFDGEGEIACPNCGRVWEFTKHSLTARDMDSEECRCGQTLYKWNGARMHTEVLVKGLPEDENRLR